MDKYNACYPYVRSFQMRRKGFVAELEICSIQVEEFAAFGELTDLGKYLKEAQDLNSELELAMEKVIQEVTA